MSKKKITILSLIFVFLLIVFVACFLKQKQENLKDPENIATDIEKQEVEEEKTDEDVEEIKEMTVEEEKMQKIRAAQEAKSKRKRYDETINYKSIHPEKEVNVSNEWKEFQLGVNGQNVQLPCKLSNFLNTSGFNLSEEDKNLEIEAGKEKELYLYNEDVKVATIICKNTNNTSSLYTDCEIIYLEQSCYDKEIAPENVIMFPGNIYIGHPGKATDLSDKLGIRTDRYDSYDIFLEEEALGIVGEPEDYCRYTWRDEIDKDGKQKLEIVASEGIVVQLVLQNAI